MLRDAAEDLLAFTGFPAAHWKKIWSGPARAAEQRSQMSHRAGEAKQRVGVGKDLDDVYRRYLGEADYGPTHRPAHHTGGGGP